MTTLKKAKEIAKISIQIASTYYTDECLKVAKNASPERKKEIENTHLQKVLKLIKDVGVKEANLQAKNALRMAKEQRAYTKKMDKLRKSSTRKERKVTCKYNKKHGSYINHFGDYKE